MPTSSQPNGWYYFVLGQNTKDPASGISWRQAATSAPDLIAEYHRLRRNLGIKCGRESDLFVIDEDKAGALALLEQAAGTQLPLTHIVHTSIDPETGFQKRHHYFKYPNAVTPIGNERGLFGGIDIRTDGGYVVAAGAKNIPILGDDDKPLLDERGKPLLHQYESQNELEPVALPLEFLHALEHEKARLSPAGRRSSDSPESNGKIEKGGRNDTLFRTACSLRKNGLGYAAIVAALREENREKCAPPLPDSEVATLAKSAASYSPAEAKEQSKPKRKLFLITSRSMQDIANEIKTWLWLNVILSGELNLFIGDPDVGKTLITVYLIARLTTGGPFPFSEKRFTPKKVLIYCTEDSYNATWKPRLLVAGANLDLVIPIHGIGTCVDDTDPLPISLDQPEHLAAIQEHIQSDPEIALVVLDPLSQMLGECDITKADVRTITSGLTNIARATNTAIIVIHHTNKRPAESAIKAAAGNFQIMAAVQNCWMFSLNAAVTGEFLMLQVRNKAGKKRTFKYRIVGRKWPVGFEPELEKGETDDGCGLIEFIGKANITADEMLQRAQEKDFSQNMKAQRWLSELLALGPVHSKHIWQEADKRGLSRNVVYLAFNDMGGSCDRKTEMWSLPETPAPPTAARFEFPDPKEME